VTDSLEILPQDWLAAVAALRADGFDYFDWLGCVDEIGRWDCFRIVLVLRNLAAEAKPRMLSCLLPRDEPLIDTVRGVFAGAAWHEREVAELFGVEFVGGERRRLLLSAGFEGTPLRRMRCWRRVPE
jgi:NADH-quinone oxidoreductase subunit C